MTVQTFTEKDKQFFDACRKGDLDLVKKCIGNGQDPRVDDNFAIRYASLEGYLDVVEYLCTKFKPGTYNGVNPTDADNAPIRNASRRGHLEIVKYLCEKCNANPTSNHNISLRLACEYGHLPVVKYLCEQFPPGTPKGVDLGVMSHAPLRFASLNGHLDIVKYLCKTFPPGTERGVKPDALDNYAINFAKTDEIKKYLRDIVNETTTTTNDTDDTTIKEKVLLALNVIQNFINKN